MANTPNRLNALYVISILKKYSSPKKPLTISEIAKHFTEDINNGTVTADNSTISRNLEDLCSDSALGFNSGVRGDFYPDIHNFGFDIHCVIQSPNPDEPWIDYTYLEPKDSTITNSANNTGTTKKAKKGPVKYYYYDPVITDTEISLLIDAIETYNFFDGDDIVGICTKLRNLHPQAFKKSTYASDRAEDDSPLFQHIDTLHQLIVSDRFAQITYCTNDYMHELIPRAGYPRIIRPLKMLWSNGYLCYGLFGSSFLTYRRCEDFCT